MMFNDLIVRKKNSYHAKKVIEIQNSILIDDSKLVFDKNLWRKKKLNCYAYVLNICIEDPKMRIFFPGCISVEKGDLNIYSCADLVTGFKNDLDFLKIRYRENADTLEKGEWRVAIYYSPTPHDWPIGFHMARQDENGAWSEKPSWEREVQSVGKRSNVPANLEKHNLYLETILIISR